MTYDFSELIDSVHADDGDGLVAAPGEHWRQGRTLFGGLTAALAVQAAQLAIPALPPLRSAQFAFTGVADGELRMQVQKISAGRSSTFVRVTAHSGEAMALHALLCFGAARDSALDYRNAPMPAVPAPEACDPFFVGPFAPRATAQFDGRLAAGAHAISGAGTPELALWLRHRDTRAADTAASIIALADAPPPGAFLMFTRPAPISTMTWAIDVLAERFDGAAWHLAQTCAQHVADGYSSQAMTLWSVDGTALLHSRQTVAVYA